jgi:hypothetical protein
MQVLKKPNRDNKVRLRWFGHVERMEENRVPKRVLYMNLGATRLRGRPRNRWQDEVREDGRIVGGEGWQEKGHNRQEWKNVLGMARNRSIPHTPMNSECDGQFRHRPMVKITRIVTHHDDRGKKRSCKDS